ncbi:hypothetical protein HOLleu_13637 [Holothuria leucospilota]|uniref:BRCT domain-containing protein n=1 Tax=Holothuria leucospilota TaxID=206669 RepID=A0A9Q1HAZ6_HOLLE|nr:hypothetical protein HOLleu_13637 [Holothuria leucospilota]
MDVGDMYLSLPKFLLIEVGLIAGKNLQNPPFLIGEDIHVAGKEYELTGAVIMRPDHFYNVVKHGEQYKIPSFPKIISSFSGAVRNDELDAALLYKTDPSNPVGVHVLLYHSKEVGRASIPFKPFILVQERTSAAKVDNPSGIFVSEDNSSDDEIVDVFELSDNEKTQSEVSEDKDFQDIEDLINLEENYSGTRLVEELRKLLPGIIPSQKEESEQKSQYLREFLSSLEPQRTPTGWRLNPHSLIALLSFKYFWADGPKYWKLYGDGREIGGRQSTYLAISFLNNEAYLHNMLYHDPNEIFPIAIFYEKDSRDNLEENCSSWLNKFITEKTKEGHTFYLCGDEMFLEAVLDGSGILAPNSESGWNIYLNMSVEDKNTTCKETGLRTSLPLQIDRCHPENLLPSIPLENVAMCIMHGLARVVEKLLTLEVQDVLSEANTSHEAGVDRGAYIDCKISTLESNVNKSGVKQGNFCVTFDKSGKLCPIKLNKDHALIILSPPPNGMSDIYPHILTNVCSQRIIKNTLSRSVQEHLQLCNDFSVFQLVQQIWKHFFEMYDILRKDPQPTLKVASREGSLDPSDYLFGYTDSDKSSYKFHAECFYQLFKLRYTYKELTPYMMKFIDVAPLLMKSLPFSLGRLQNEGGEHANYLHNRFYYHHTTRHGGVNRVDPILALFNNMYKRISFDILKGNGSDCGVKASDAFKKYMRNRVATSGILEGIKVKDITDHVGEHHTSPKTISKGIFDKQTFVLCGAIPKINGKSYSHGEFEKLIAQESGKVKKKVPSSCVSTKKYIVLVNPNVSSKKTLPLPVREAIKAGHPVLDFKFIVMCLEKGAQLDSDAFKIDLSKCPLKYTKRPTLDEKHFRHLRVMTSLIKTKRSFKRLKIPVCRKRIYNPGLHFVWQKIKQERRKSNLTLTETRALMSRFFQQWKLMSKEKRDLYRNSYLKGR